MHCKICILLFFFVIYDNKQLCVKFTNDQALAIKLAYAAYMSDASKTLFESNEWQFFLGILNY